MNKNIEHYVFHKENFLEESYCKNTIDELNKCGWKKHEWYSATEDVYRQLSADSEPDTLGEVNPKNSEKINDFIISSLHSTLHEYINKFKFDWFNSWAGYTTIKFIRYSVGQTMHQHCDHIHSMFDGEKKGIPVLSIIGILNDDYEGGELIMFGDKKIDTKKGDLLIFPSNFLYPHEITPVTRGVRYSYTSWVW